MPPFTDGVAGAAELARRGLEAVRAGEGDALLVEAVAVGAHPVVFKVSAVHGAQMASFGRRCSGSRRS